MGEPNDQSRTEDSIRLLTYGFRFYETHKLYNAATPLVKARVWQGAETESQLGLADDLYVTVPTGQFKRLQASLALNNPLKAPIFKGQSYGLINIVLSNQVISSKPLVALHDNPKGGLLRRATDSVSFTIHKYFSKNEEQVNTA